MNYSTVMEKEIREEPEILRNILKNNISILTSIKNFLKKRDIDGVYISARGTSDNASTLGKYLIESILGYVTALSAPSLFTIYKTPPSLRNKIVVGVSQSGKSEDVCEVLKWGKKEGAFCIAITNHLDSPLANLADEVLPCWAGEEKSVPATKTYLAEIFNMYLFCSVIGDKSDMLNLLKDMPFYISDIIEKASQIDVGRFHFMDRCICIGRGFNYSTAMEFSLKLKETSYVFAEAYSSADFLHGPLALVSYQLPIFVFLPLGPTYRHLKEVIDTLKEKTEDIFIFSFGELEIEKGGFVIPYKTDEILSPILFTSVFQIFANKLALDKGFNPDNPRFLKKVTITR
ncbi:MAG: SIS domain-containing protein [bacterium]|nr:SIS domain-containing protein [bacterium]